MVAKCAVPFLWDLNVERNFLKPARPGGKKKIFSFSSKTGKLEESCEVLVYISIKGAEGKYKFLGEANTCL